MNKKILCLGLSAGIIIGSFTAVFTKAEEDRDINESVNIVESSGALDEEQNSRDPLKPHLPHVVQGSSEPYEDTAQKTSGSSSGSSSGSGGGSYKKKTTTTETASEPATAKPTGMIKEENPTEMTTQQQNVRVSIGSDTVMIGEKSFKMDAKPYIQASSSSTLVPLRFVTAALFDEGMTDADKSTLLQWNGEDKTVTVKAKGKTVIFKADSGIMSVDGKKLLMANGVKAEIKDGRMYIPFRALGKALDITVDWDEESRTAIYRQK